MGNEQNVANSLGQWYVCMMQRGFKYPLALAPLAHANQLPLSKFGNCKVLQLASHGSQAK